MKISNSLNKLKDKLFTKIHTSNLVYNTCWEDPRVDKSLLDFDKDSSIVMITSAGCNALDYLLEDVTSINCIDVNPRQNALLNLKRALFTLGLKEELKQMFQNGSYGDFVSLLNNKLASHLTESEVEYWNKKAKYFTKKKSFYHRGTSGQFAHLFSKYLDSYPKARIDIDNLLNAKTDEEQLEAYHQLEPKIFSNIVNWAMNRHLTMSLLGVPRSQREMMQQKYPGGMSNYLKETIGHVLRDLPIHDNYFWRVYITGKYTDTCKPGYLEEDNFETLKERVSRIKTHTTYLSTFLKENPSKYSHFILLDHQDWLAQYDIDALHEEWRLVLENSKPGTKIIMRSAMDEIDFLPDFVTESVTENIENAAEHHVLDRVGTYASVKVMTVK